MARCNLPVSRLLIDPYDKSNDEVSNLTIGDLVSELPKFAMENQCTRHLHSSPKLYISKDCKFVWLKTDRFQKSVEGPYIGLYEVVNCNKYFTITTADVNSHVSINRLKPAFISEIMKIPNIHKAIPTRRYISPYIDWTMETRQPYTTRTKSCRLVTINVLRGSVVSVKK